MKGIFDCGFYLESLREASITSITKVQQEITCNQATKRIHLKKVPAWILSNITVEYASSTHPTACNPLFLSFKTKCKNFTKGRQIAAAWVSRSRYITLPFSAKSSTFSVQTHLWFGLWYCGTTHDKSCTTNGMSMWETNNIFLPWPYGLWMRWNSFVVLADSRFHVCISSFLVRGDLLSHDMCLCVCVCDCVRSLEWWWKNLDSRSTAVARGFTQHRKTNKQLSCRFVRTLQMVHIPPVWHLTTLQRLNR